MKQNIHDVIESFYQSIFQNEHIFFQDMKKFQQFIPVSSIKQQNNKMIPDQSQFTEELQKCNLQPFQRATNKQLQQLINMTTIQMSWEQKQIILDDFMLLSVPDTILNVKEKLKQLQNEKKKYPWQLNFLILGGGPAGLYALNYLNESFSHNPNTPRIGILLIENRITEEHWREPFLRNRPYSIDSPYFSFLFPNIYCTKPKESVHHKLLIQIRYLELLLYAKAYQSKQNQLLFTNQFQSWKDIEKIIKLGNFDIVLDATGKRLKIPLFKSVQSDWLSKSVPLQTNQFQIQIHPELNIAKLYPRFMNEEESGLVFLFGEIIHEGRIIERLKDTPLWNKNESNFAQLYLHNQCILVSALSSILSFFNPSESLFLFIQKLISQYPDKYVKFMVFHNPLEHALQISEYFKVNKKDVLYIGIGDTIFKSHFVIGAGLGRTIRLTSQILQYLPNAYFTEHYKKKGT